MKRILLIILVILSTTVHLFAQQNGGAKIKALKTAYITNALELSSKEAQQFWPIYNAYENTVREEKTLKMRQLTRRVSVKGGVDNLTDAEADNLLEAFIAIDFKVATAKKELYTKLKGVISAKKMIKLTKVEQDFNRELLKQLRNTRMNTIKNRNGN